MDGIDISNWQAGLDLGAVPCDFVIIKATEGSGYVDPTFTGFTERSLALGKLTGAYHYARGDDPVTEANQFINTVRPYVGRILLALDWESGGNTAWGNSDWIRRFVNHVHEVTGVWPLVYTQASALDQPPQDILDHCPLWVAQYADMNTTGYQPTPWNEGAYQCLIRQYSGTGRLPGWNGDLDLDKYYGTREQWESLTKGEDMPTAQEIADAVWNFNQNGTLMRDRVQGTDQGVQNLNKRLFGGADEFKWLTDRVYRIANLLFNRKDNAGTGMVDGQGHDVERTLYDRVAWIDKRVRELNEQSVGTPAKILDLNKRLDAIEAKLDQLLATKGASNE